MKADDTRSAEARDTQMNTTYVWGKWNPFVYAAGLSFMISQSVVSGEDSLQRMFSLFGARAPLTAVWVKLGLMKQNKIKQKIRVWVWELFCGQLLKIKTNTCAKSPVHFVSRFPHTRGNVRVIWLVYNDKRRETESERNKVRNTPLSVREVLMFLFIIL